HADLAGGLKYGRRDLRDVLERASARETAARVSAGAIARALLRQFCIEIVSHVIEIGGAAIADPLSVSFEQARALSPDDDVRCVDAEVAAAMRRTVDAARDAGDAVRRRLEGTTDRPPVGLGTY